MKNNVWKLVQIAGLAVSIPFEIAAGPFIGYFIGDYVIKQFAFHKFIMYVFIAMGFAASVTNTALIVRMMVLINKDISRNAE